ncbi:glycosyltransferase family 4 protein [Salinibacterium soli]|uniref:Glycosyltransferase family 1 protein n=1 Tax=Antiquaquibacter soli TaxID=3064523 RepID=A0ABT9BNL9_9MICO|nr:glycosyltransferase family 1 protein [Protaetiibacter sp. WY-16]MDO7881020.1 glycosyltransferase family 1 protein [Protaetiibacter sp. WY-16]
MRIGLDAYWLIDGPPSGRNVVRGLIAGWSVAFPDDEILVRVPRRHEAAAREWLERQGIRARIVRSRWPNHALSVLLGGWSGKRPDAVVTENFTALSGPRPAVYVHDAIFMEHPEWFTRAERLYLSLIGATLGRARVVLASSRSEAARIGRSWPRVASRLAVVGYGVPLGLDAAEPSRPSAVAEGARPFILSVGRLNSRKNLGALLRAFVGDSSLSADADLLIVGEPNGRVDPALAGADASAVRFLGYVSDDELAWLYSNARLFVFPSLDEGYGLPLIEAARFSATSVASRIPPFEELGLSAESFDPRDPADIARALRAALDREPAPAALPAEVSWPAVARSVRSAALRG